uniref:DAGKc domain-containing protein n=1 Tax=Timema cristinae TaxID=61476 RepID=A0A7R9CDB8_TIMCR|nr:unnamed protein product [Timema cristinae]
MSETEDNVQICDPVLLNSFIIKNKRCRVYFHRGRLIWETDGSPYNRYTLLLADVIAVDYVHSTDKTLCCPSESQGYNQEESKPAGDSNPGLSQRHTSFIIHYGVRGRNNNKWRHHTVTMNHTDPRQIASWVKTIHNYINSFTKRPKRIMVFVNPYGGKKKGLQIYEKRVKPLFELAGVHTTITITQSANHARDTLLTCSFDNIDAITCVGGDGTFAEVFNGLVLRTAKDKGIDQNDPEAILPTPSLRVGIIPAGSTDTMAYCFHGTTDVQTAVLLIIFGDSVGLDLCSVHSNATLLRYYSSVISYGYLGDVVRDSEKFRWMGPKRYDYSGFKKFFANVGYDGEVSLLSDSSDPSKGPKCKDNCERCNKNQHKGQSIKEASAGVSGTGMDTGVTDASTCTSVSIVLCLFHLASEMGRRASLSRLLEEVRVSEEGQSCADKWPKSPEVSRAV